MFNNFISPNNKNKLVLRNNKFYDGELEFDIFEGIPNFIFPKNLSKQDFEAKNFYEGRAAAYEQYLHLTFETYGENEIKIRNDMIDLLDIKKNSKVLEVACGTGRDSVLIDKRITDKSEFHLTDISHDMIKVAKQKLEKSKNKIFFSLANAINLPYPDNYFDFFYSFGAVGEFSDTKKFFQEIIRVCKKGAKVVIGDENLPIWQRETKFGKILSNYNKQFLSNIPFKDFPVEARKVKCQWIIGDVFYLVDFIVGDGELYANFDFEIPGIRGGTHKTRYYGMLEGVKEETAKIAWKAVEKKKTNMHSWLDKIVKKEAKKILDDK